MNNEQNSIDNIIKIEYLTPKNAKFSLTKNGFLQLSAEVPNPEMEKIEKEKENESKREKIEFDRVYLHRAFPYDDPFSFISVQGSFPKPPPKEDEKKEDKDNKENTENDDKDDKEKGKKEKEDDKKNLPPKGDIREIGLISKLDIFSKEEQEYIKAELERKYYTPILKKIISIKEKYGYSYWVVDTSAGKINFTIHDTYRNIHKVDDNRLFISDINGNRYEIPSVEAFDPASLKKIEIYL